jgi:hypothetical protein
MRTPNVRAAASCGALALALLAAGCGGDSGTSAPPSKPSKDFAAEAKSSINDANRDAELDKLKSEIESDK